MDIIFHKCKPQGGRRFSFPHYLKALAAASEECGNNTFESIGLLGLQLKPKPSFVALTVRGGVRRGEADPNDEKKAWD